MRYAFWPGCVSKGAAPELYQSMVWALAKSGNADEAQCTIDQADANFSDPRFTQRLAAIAADNSA